MKPLRLTPQAHSRLSEIADWTIKNFGHKQAAAYERDLINRLNALAKGDLPKGRSCNTLFPDRPDITNLYFIREDAHFIIYRDTPTEIQILDFVHGSRNLEAILNDLTADVT